MQPSQTTKKPRISVSLTDDSCSVTPITLSFNNLPVEIGHGFNRALNKDASSNYFTCPHEQRSLFLFSAEVSEIFNYYSPTNPITEFHSTAYNFFFSAADGNAFYPESQSDQNQRLSNAPLKPLLNDASIISKPTNIHNISESTKLLILESIYNYSITLSKNIFHQDPATSCSIS